jgi:phage FluMu protein Com
MTKCPKCKKTLNIGKLLREWDDEYGSEWIGEAMVNIICPHCQEGVMVIYLQTYEESEDVESPAGKVKIPKLKDAP